MSGSLIHVDLEFLVILDKGLLEHLDLRMSRIGIPGAVMALNGDLDTFEFGGNM